MYIQGTSCCNDVRVTGSTNIEQLYNYVSYMHKGVAIWWWSCICMRCCGLGICCPTKPDDDFCFCCKARCQLVYRICIYEHVKPIWADEAVITQIFGSSIAGSTSATRDIPSDPKFHIYIVMAFSTNGSRHIENHCGAHVRSNCPNKVQGHCKVCATPGGFCLSVYPTVM